MIGKVSNKSQSKDRWDLQQRNDTEYDTKCERKDTNKQRLQHQRIHEFDFFHYDNKPQQKIETEKREKLGSQEAMIGNN